MQRFSSAFEAIVEAGIPAATKRFGSALNVQWVDEALQHTGTVSVRRRRLPARLVVWLVISMALFRDCAIRTVATQLGMDGTTLNVPDTRNEEAFGLPGSGRGRPGHPQVRLVALMPCAPRGNGAKRAALRLDQRLDQVDVVALALGELGLVVDLGHQRHQALLQLLNGHAGGAVHHVEERAAVPEVVVQQATFVP